MLKISYLRVQCLHEVFINLTVHVYISVSFKQVRPLLYSGHQFVKDIVKMNKILLQNRNKFRSLCNNASALHNARHMSSDPLVFVDGV